MDQLFAILAAVAVAGASFLLGVAGARGLLARYRIRRRTQRLLEIDPAGGGDWGTVARHLWAMPAGQRAAAACVALALILLVVGTIVLGWLQGLAMAAVALGVAYWLARQVRTRRRDRLEAQLVPALRMMAAGTESGYSVQQALERAAIDSPSPIAEEFALAVRQIALGVSLEGALVELGRRGGENFELLAHIVIVQYRAGGSLPSLLLGLATNVQERLQFRDEARALTAQARYSGLVLGLLPFAFLALVAVVSPDYLHALVATERGRVLMLGAAGVLAIGLGSIRAISQVEI